MASRRSSTPRTTTSSKSVPSTSYLGDDGMKSIGTRRPKGRPKTATSTGVTGDQHIVCALTESRGLAPTVGLAFVNLSTTEAVLCQIADNQTYVKTLNKLHVLEPTEILIMTSAVAPNKSKLFQILEANLVVETIINPLPRRFWDETAGMDYIQNLAFKEDIKAIKVSIGGNFYAMCCLAAVGTLIGFCTQHTDPNEAIKYVESSIAISFSFHSMRIKYEPSDGAMMMDLATIRSLELVQNLQKAKSKHCLVGLLDHTFTPMGQRMLRSNILQPLTSRGMIETRYDALDELSTNEEMFLAIRQALKAFMDVDRVLTDIVIVPAQPSVEYLENSINRVIQVKQYLSSIPALHEALEGCCSELLRAIQKFCAPDATRDARELINDTINEDATYQKKPIDLRNQRTYAVKSGVNGLLDVARTTYKEANQDASQLLVNLRETHNMNLELKFDHARQYYFTLLASDLEDRTLPPVFINHFRKKTLIECQTLDLKKLNQKITDSHHEVLGLSHRVVQNLIENIRDVIAPLFKTSESIAMLDVLASLADVTTTQGYCRPELSSTLAVKAGRHPLREKFQMEKFVPNDVYATSTSRLQIITGCNMSGKSTYIRSVALMTIMAQVGSFVPATNASFTIRHQLFARVSVDDSSTSNVSTFAAEMRETAFILRNIDAKSLVIIDELGRGTSTRDGLAIAIAVAEALVHSNALIWFVTHFRELAVILSERPGVTNFHLASELHGNDRMTMLHQISKGPVEESHYGIKLARVAGLPPQVLKIAEHVSHKLEEAKKHKIRTSKVVIQARRRKLVLGLREQLIQAKEGTMEGEVLRLWLKQLQEEFVRRMSSLDEDEQNAGDEPNDAATDVVACMLDSGLASKVDHEAARSEMLDNEACSSTDMQKTPRRREIVNVHRPLSSRSSLVYTPSNVDPAMDARYQMHGAL